LEGKIIPGFPNSTVMTDMWNHPQDAEIHQCLDVGEQIPVLLTQWLKPTRLQQDWISTQHSEAIFLPSRQ